MAGASTLSYRGKRVGTGRGEPWSDADIARVRELRGQGTKPKQIAAILGVKPDRVYYLLQRLGDSWSTRLYRADRVR